jgi:hypothetical protein
MKLFQLLITNCGQCPNCGTDQNITRYECKAKNNNFICWDNSDVFEDDTTPIPKWCPLQDIVSVINTPMTEIPALTQN